MKEWLLNQSLTLIVTPILGAVGTIIGVSVKKFFDSKTKATDTKKHLRMLDELILSAVETANQKEVDYLKDSGEWTKEKEEEVFQRVRQIVMSLLTTETQKVLAESYVNYEKFIELRIEKTVKDAKNKKELK